MTTGHANEQLEKKNAMTKGHASENLQKTSEMMTTGHAHEQVQKKNGMTAGQASEELQKKKAMTTTGHAREQFSEELLKKNGTTAGHARELFSEELLKKNGTMTGHAREQFSEELLKKNGTTTGHASELFSEELLKKNGTTTGHAREQFSEDLLKKNGTTTGHAREQFSEELLKKNGTTTTGHARELFSEQPQKKNGLTTGHADEQPQKKSAMTTGHAHEKLQKISAMMTTGHAHEQVQKKNAVATGHANEQLQKKNAMTTGDEHLQEKYAMTMGHASEQLQNKNATKIPGATAATGCISTTSATSFFSKISPSSSFISKLTPSSSFFSQRSIVSPTSAGSGQNGQHQERLMFEKNWFPGVGEGGGNSCNPYNGNGDEKSSPSDIGIVPPPPPHPTTSSDITASTGHFLAVATPSASAPGAISADEDFKSQTSLTANEEGSSGLSNSTAAVRVTDVCKKVPGEVLEIGTTLMDRNLLGVVVDRARKVPAADTSCVWTRVLEDLLQLPQTEKEEIEKESDNNRPPVPPSSCWAPHASSKSFKVRSFKECVGPKNRQKEPSLSALYKPVCVEFVRSEGGGPLSKIASHVDLTTPAQSQQSSSSNLHQHPPEGYSFEKCGVPALLTVNAQIPLDYNKATTGDGGGRGEGLFGGGSPKATSEPKTPPKPKDRASSAYLSVIVYYRITPQMVCWSQKLTTGDDGSRRIPPSVRLFKNFLAKGKSDKSLAFKVQKSLCFITLITYV